MLLTFCFWLVMIVMRTVGEDGRLVIVTCIRLLSAVLFNWKTREHSPDCIFLANLPSLKHLNINKRRGKGQKKNRVCIVGRG